ncbi:Alpha/Beta hydrolase protein [Pelagophyceae sp. CCMP2097]|nr:Alpha/Beta hydrolase protein [Pelagophyceae sp. CCMP2097]
MRPLVRPRTRRAPCSLLLMTLATYEVSTLRSSMVGEAPPLLILHGLLGSARNFRSWSAALAPALQKPRRVYSVDLRNHGASFQADTMSYAEQAEDVLATMDALGVDRAAILGHSMGGKVAMAMALARPDRVDRLCVFDIAPAPYSVADSSNWRASRDLMLALQELREADLADRRTADNALARRVLDPNIRAFALANLEQVPGSAALRWKCNLDALVCNLDVVAGWALVAAAPAPAAMYPGAALFVAGGNSRYVRSAHLRDISALFPRFTLETIPQTGHWIHAEAPEKTVDAARRFLDADL